MKLLAAALEAQTAEVLNASAVPEDQTVVMMGPLSAIYAKALDIAYAKPDPAMESQQMDVAIMQKLASSLSGNMPAPTDNFQTVYGVSRDAVTDDIVIDVTKELVKKNGDFYLIIDGTQPGVDGNTNSAPQETLRQIAALECLVQAHGGKVFTSLQEFAKSR